MNAELKAKWVAALRSGDYKQAVSSLCFVKTPGEPSFCCLGVLCEVSEFGRWGGSMHYPDYIPHDFSPAEGGILPVGLAELAGLSTETQKVLAGMNDRDHKTLAEIADYIEAHL